MTDFSDKKQYPEHQEAVHNHIESYFGDSDMKVFHEIATSDIHIDIYHIKPQNANFEILITSGMSSIAMNVSELGAKGKQYEFAEFVTLIPKGVIVGETWQIYPSGTKYDWIISMIKYSAKFPHYYDTWVGIGHTIQANEEMQPYTNDTPFCGCLILPTVTFPEEFQIIHTPNGIINIYGIFPLYKEELKYKIENGYNNFLDFLIEHNAKEVIDFDRVNYCEDLGIIDKVKRWAKGFLGR